MRNKLLFLLFVLFLFPSCIFAKIDSTIELGKLEKSELQLVYLDSVIDAYKLYDTNYILVSDLKYLGCCVIYSPSDRTVTITPPTHGETVPEVEDTLTNQAVTFFDGKVLLDHFETQALSCDGRTLIPLAALNRVGTLTITDNQCYFVPGDSIPLAVGQSSISNLSGDELKVTTMDIYWKDEIIQIPASYVLAPYQESERPLTLIDEDAIYISSVVQTVEGGNYSYFTTSTMGQVNNTLMKKYHEGLTNTPVTGYGDPISTHDIDEAEAFINSKNLSSPTKYLVWTNIAKQRTYIFQGSNHNWKLFKTFICSTGRDATPTPKGTFSLTRKVPSFGQNKGYCCKYAFGFIGTTYLYHSIIFDKTGTYLLENKGVLGKKASEGCIRFSEENAKWFYDHMISGTTVYIN